MPLDKIFMAKSKIEWTASERKDIRRDADMEVKMDEQTLNEIDDKLSKAEWHLANILDSIENIGFDREEAERLVIQARDLLIQQTKEQSNDK
jgi:hypothetical protein